jgi:hypothetical protein
MVDAALGWRRNHVRLMLATVLLCGLLIRLPFIATNFHNAADLDLYKHWAKLVATRGLTTIYEHTGIDYPPLLLYLFGGAQLAASYFPAPLRAHDNALTALDYLGNRIELKSGGPQLLLALHESDGPVYLKFPK